MLLWLAISAFGPVLGMNKDSFYAVAAVLGPLTLIGWLAFSVVSARSRYLADQERREARWMQEAAAAMREARQVREARTPASEPTAPCEVGVEGADSDRGDERSNDLDDHQSAASTLHPARVTTGADAEHWEGSWGQVPTHPAVAERQARFAAAGRDNDWWQATNAATRHSVPTDTDPGNYGEIGGDLAGDSVTGQPD